MKNLKKVLALVLALVMVFGVMSVAGAAFTDDAQIENTTAANVLNGIEVLEGYPDGSFNPQGNITREEMATIICKMLLSPAVAKTLVQGTSNFTDVEADRWSAGYIEYCANLGIIDGYGDGTFKPTGNVTIGEAAKMLLVAAGIKGTYTGADWLVNVTANAVNAGILPVAVDAAAVATRDQVAQYAFAALNYTTIAGSVYRVYNGQTLVATYPDALTAIAAAAGRDGYTVAIAPASTDSIAWKVFKLTSETTTDLFGRPATRWYIETNVVANGYQGPAFNANAAYVGDKLIYNAVAEADVVYTTPVNVVAMSEILANYNALGYTLYYNGNVVTAADAATIAGATGFGIRTEFFVNPILRTVQIVIITEGVGTVIGVASYPQTAFQGAYTTYSIDTDGNPANGAEQTIKIFTTHVKEAIEVDTGAVVGTVAVGSVVVLTGIPDVFVIATPANSVTGVVNSLDRAKSTIVINGTTYNIATCFNPTTLDVMSANLTKGVTGTFYLDQYGYVVMCDYRQAQNYAQLNSSLLYDVLGLGGTSLVKAVEAELVFADGTTKKVALDTITVGGTVYGANANQALGVTALTDQAQLDGYELDVFTYTVNELTGAYSLTAVVDVEDSKTIKPVHYFDGTNLANNNTTFVVRTGGVGAYVWNVYTGFANLPANLEAGTSTVAAVDKNGDNVEDLVFITANPNYTIVREYVYVTSANPTYHYDGATGVTTLTYPTLDGDIKVKLYANGNNPQSIKIDAPGLYVIQRYNAQGDVSVVSKVQKAAVQTPGVAGLITIGSDVWSYNANSKLVVFQDGVKVDTYTWETLLPTSGNNFEYVVEAYVKPATAIVGNQVVDTTTIDTAYVVITTTYTL